jgi:hypothetical protein
LKSFYRPSSRNSTPEPFRAESRLAFFQRRFWILPSQIRSTLSMLIQYRTMRQGFP